MVRNWKFLSVYPLPDFLAPLPLISFTDEEFTGCPNEAGKGANKEGKNPPSCFFVSCFTVLVITSIIHLNLLMILRFY